MQSRDAPSVMPVGDDFACFFRRNYQGVVGLAAVLCGSMETAEDLAQEAFAAAQREWPRIGVYDNPAAWVRRAVVNRAASLRRRRFVEARALLRLRGRRQLDPDTALAPEDAAVWRAVRGLSRRQAQVVALVYLEDLSIAEAAIVLGCGEGTAKTHLRRAKAALADRLGETDAEEDR
jgi:RNA polymerase sigma-70 factor, ECF subfamily